MAPQQQETDALIIASRDQGESDKIITLFSRDFGRISCIVKGAKKSKKRFVNKLEIFSFLHITFTDYPNRSLAFLNEAELHTSFIQLRQNYSLYITSSIIQEFLLHATREREADFSMFQLSLWALHNLNQSLPTKTVLTLFLIRFFDLLGYRPNLSHCQHCGCIATPKNRFIFHNLTGGLTCSDCTQHTRCRFLSPGTIRFLASAQDQPLEKLNRIKASGSILPEALNLLHLYGRTIFQRDITSWKMLR